jgi:hypothetical protein
MGIREIFVTVTLVGGAGCVGDSSATSDSANMNENAGREPIDEQGKYRPVAVDELPGIWHDAEPPYSTLVLWRDGNYWWDWDRVDLGSGYIRDSGTYDLDDGELTIQSKSDEKPRSCGIMEWRESKHEMMLNCYYGFHKFVRSPPKSWCTADSDCLAEFQSQFWTPSDRDPIIDYATVDTFKVKSLSEACRPDPGLCMRCEVREGERSGAGTHACVLLDQPKGS